MFKHFIQATALVAAALLAGPAFAQQHDSGYGHNDDRGDRDRGDNERGDHGRGDGYRVVCESINSSRRYCAVNLRVYDVSLNRQLSDSRCEEGRSWGHDRHGIWVAGGCRGEFAVTAARGRDWGNQGGGNRVIRCESVDGTRAYCETGGSNVRLVNQLSNSACIEDRTWGYNRRGLWVDHGCRADFRLLR